MARFELYQKGPEDFYGNIITSTNIVYKRSGTTITSVDGTIETFPTKFEYPSDSSMIISTLTINNSDIAYGDEFSIEITCNIPKCVETSVKGMDFYGNEFPDLDTQYWSITSVDDTDSKFTINIKSIFTEAFENSNASMETIYAACLVFDFKDGTSFVNMSTNSYNETIGDVSNEFIDGSKISYTFMTKPSDVQRPVRIPMYYMNELADVFRVDIPLTIQTNYPAQTSSYFKEYYISRSTSNIIDNSFKLGKSENIYQTNINEIYNNILTEEDKQNLNNGNDVDLYLWMFYSAPRQITPFNQRKIRIIKAY